MFLLAHLGFSLAAYEALRRRVAWLHGVPWWAVAFGAILPDLIDKPLGLFILEWGRGRLYGHTLVFVVALVVLASLLRAPRSTGLMRGIAFGASMHLVLDRMWEMPQTFLWPLLGASLRRADVPRSQMLPWFDTSVYFLATEAAGLLLLAWAAWRHAHVELTHDASPEGPVPTRR